MVRLVAMQIILKTIHAISQINAEQCLEEKMIKILTSIVSLMPMALNNNTKIPNP
jgi:hypothetical protein